MQRWRAMLFLGGGFEEDEFSDLKAAQEWAEERLKEVDENVPLRWRQIGNWYDVGARPDFSARVVSIE